jgi:catechol 2,3-dioxygenase
MGASLDELFGGQANTQPATPDSYGVQPSGYRLPASAHIASVTLQVSDLARSRQFYEQVLGLQPLGVGDGWVRLGAQNGSATLVELLERRPERPAARHKRLGLYHVAILLPTRADLGRFLRHLQETGVRAGAGDHLVSEALYLQDPDDLGIEVYADRPAEGWRRRERELVMATDPVDIAGLLAAAGPARWSGMPAFTTVGHVHLHVGDIPMAARFYSDALGMDRMVWSYPGALFLAAGGYHHHLGTNTWAGAAARPPAADEPQLVQWTMVLPTAADVRAAGESLQRAGYHATADGDVLVVRDPWGTTLRLRPADAA